jgi:hypothetical protein
MNLLRQRTVALELPRPAMLFVLFLLISGDLRADDSQHEILFFTSVDAFDNFSLSDPDLGETFMRPAVDILYSYSGDRFRFLGEYLWSSHESELERLKLGWQAGDNTMLWFGRFHSSAKFWTSEYHHGQFMQTSITRPSIDEWEDESGPIPSHLTGFSIEHESLRKDETAIDYVFSVGLAPKFSGEELQPYDMLDPESGHGLSINYRMAYRPDIFSDSQFGFMVGGNDINVVSESNPALAELNDIQQLTIGIFADWRWKEWRVLANAMHFESELNYVDETIDDDFFAAYLQIEYGASEDWTVFGRVDYSSGEDQSQYLLLLPSFVAHRHMIGVRWDFLHLQSLALEVAETSSQSETVDHDTFKEARFQWSAVFP